MALNQEMDAFISKTGLKTVCDIEIAHKVWNRTENKGYNKNPKQIQVDYIVIMRKS